MIFAIGSRGKIEVHGKLATTQYMQQDFARRVFIAAHQQTELLY